MKERGYCYPHFASQLGMAIVECGPLGTVVRIHDRPVYTRNEARLVCRWVNGFDQPLEAMKHAQDDEWDPINRQIARGGGVTQRVGLTPLPDKE